MRINKDWTLVKIRGFYTLLLIVILASGLFLNFCRLEKRSLLDWDEAYYLEVIKTWRAGADWITYKIFKPVKVAHLTFSGYVLKHGGAINTFAKDGFLAIVFLFSFLAGIRDVTILWVSSIFGVLTVWIVYLIGKESRNRLSGLLSCIVLVTSVFHLHYARSGFPQTTSTFFLYLAVFLYILSRKYINDTKISNRFLFFSAVVLGYGFTCHYSLFPALSVFFIFEIMGGSLFSCQISSVNFLKRAFLLFVGILIPVFLLGGISELIKLALYSNPHNVEAIRGSSGIGAFVSYFDRIRNFSDPILSKGPLDNNAFHIRTQINPLFYIRLLFLWEGLLVLILLLLGILRLAYRQLFHRIFSEFIILALFLIPFLFWSFHSWQLSRSFLAVIPAMALIIGSMLAWAVEKACKTEITKARALFIILFFFLFQARGRLGQEVSYVSGYPAAIKFMKEHLGIKHLSSEYTISRFFVGRENALDISTSFNNTDVTAKLKELYDKRGYRYLLLDQFRYVFNDSPIIQAADVSPPILIVPHSTDANLFENNMIGFADAVHRAAKTLKIYELNKIIDNLK